MKNKNFRMYVNDDVINIYNFVLLKIEKVFIYVQYDCILFEFLYMVFFESEYF